MKNKLKLLAALLCGILSSCATSPEKVSSPSFPKMETKIVKIKKGLVINESFKPPVGTFKNKVWDLNKSTVELTGGHCDNSESGEKIVVNLDGVTIQNGKISKFEDGLNLKAKGITVKNVVFSACEDAINSGEGCENFTITNCYFAPHEGKKSSEVFKGDKACQMNVNKGENSIVNNTFYDFMNAIRHGLKKYDNNNGTTTIKGNKFYYISTAVQNTTGKVKMSDNKFVSVGEEYKETE